MGICKTITPISKYKLKWIALIAWFLKGNLKLDILPSKSFRLIGGLIVSPSIFRPLTFSNISERWTYRSHIDLVRQWGLCEGDGAGTKDCAQCMSHVINDAHLTKWANNVFFSDKLHFGLKLFLRNFRFSVHLRALAY